MSEVDSSLLLTVLEQLPEGIVILNDRDEIAFINRAAELVRGVSRDNLVGRPVRDCHQAESGQRVARALDYLRSDAGKAFTRMVEDQRQGRFYENTYAAVKNADGRFLGSMVLSRDITDRRRLEAERAAHTRELSERVEDLSAKLHGLFAASMACLVQVLEAKDPYTQGHSVRVARLATVMGEYRWGVSPQTADLELAGKLHDIGKVAIHENVLNKPGPLSADEYAHVKTHPVEGEKIIAEIPRLQSVAQVVRHHHERFDGGGYPDGLAREDIPLASRIIAVADSYDAMTSSRPYRPAMPSETAAYRIQAGAGTQFDPDLVDLFLDLFRSGTLG